MIYLLDTNTVSYLVESSRKAKKVYNGKTRGQLIIEKIREVGHDNVFVNPRRQ